MQNIVSQRDEDRETIEVCITSEYSDAAKFAYTDIGRGIFGGRAYYIEFDSKELNDDESYYYAFVDGNGCKLLDGEQETIEFLEGLYNQRRRLVDKLREFEILDVVTAILAFIVVVSYVITICIWRADSAPWRDGLQGMAAGVIGYYFGRAKS